MARRTRDTDAPTKSAAERSEEHAQKIADLIVEQLQKGVAPWQRPWENSRSGFPTNAISDAPYRGSNAVYLMAQSIQNGYQDGRWVTFKQAIDLGGSVRKGEHGTQICYPVRGYMRTAMDEHTGKPKLGDDGQPKKEYVAYSHPQMKYYTVFAVEQCDGLEKLRPREPGPAHEWKQHDRAEAIIRAYQEETGVKITHGGNRAFYSPTFDSITVPNREQFPTVDRYIATVFHEIGHSTGSPERLARDLSGEFGSESYAKEELRAEISSLMVGQTLDLGHDPEQHAAYVQTWIKVLQDDPKEIVRACNDASKIHDYVMEYDRTRTTEITEGLTDKQAHDIAKTLSAAYDSPALKEFVQTGAIREGLESLLADEGAMRAGAHLTVDSPSDPLQMEKTERAFADLKAYVQAAGERGPVHDWELHDAERVIHAMPGAVAHGSDGRTSLTADEIAEVNPTYVNHEPGRAEEFSGEYLGFSDTHVFQAGERGELLAHDRRFFEGAELPSVGDRMHVAYHPTQERADVRELPTRELALAYETGRDVGE